MSNVTSNPFKLNIVASTTGPWTPPYVLPIAPGEVVKIAGDAVPTAATISWTGNGNAYSLTGSSYATNCPGDVRPSEIGGPSTASFMWGGGDTRTKFIESFSPAGAVVIAGSGGHKGTPCQGAMLFDFTDARFKRIWTTAGNPGVDNITNEGLQPPDGPVMVDVRSGTTIHGVAHSEDDLTEWYVNDTGLPGTVHDFAGVCWNPDHWSTNGGTTSGGGSTSEQRGYVPLQADPRNQHWEVSRTEPAAYNVTTNPHGWKFPGEWNGLLGGRYDSTGYVMPSLPGSTRNPPNNPVLAGTLEPTQSEVPAPAHIWDQYYELKPSEGGGPRGSICTGRHFNIGDSGTTNLPWSHRFDLHTGIWHRFGTNSPLQGGDQSPGGGPTGQPSAIAGAEDPILRRGFLVAKEIFDAAGRVNYINMSDKTWRNFAIDNGVGGGYSVPNAILTEYLVVDPDRRLLLLAVNAIPHIVAIDLQTLGQTGTPEPTPSHALGGWRIVPYDDIPGVQSVPPFVSTAEAGTAYPHGGQIRMPWRYYPPNGKFYRVNAKYVGGGFQAAPPADRDYQITVLQRLTPPPIIPTPRPNFYYTTEAMSGRWTLDEITLDHGLPIPSAHFSYAACGFSLFHYVPAIQCFAYLPIDFQSPLHSNITTRRCVYLIKPY